MKDITKQNFRYCLAESQGKGCLCAAMFHLKCGDDNEIILNFKADDTSYGSKTRDSWLVGYPGENEMEGFYQFHKSFQTKNGILHSLIGMMKIFLVKCMTFLIVRFLIKKTKSFG